MERLATPIEPNPTHQEVTNGVKLGGGTRQTATQVKGWSPVIINVVEADTVD